jgi:hypothetical protein
MISLITNKTKRCKKDKDEVSHKKNSFSKSFAKTINQNIEQFIVEEIDRQNKLFINLIQNDFISSITEPEKDFFLSSQWKEKFTRSKLEENWNTLNNLISENETLLFLYHEIEDENDEKKFLKQDDNPFKKEDYFIYNHFLERDDK